jgi:hypothetical protein
MNALLIEVSMERMRQDAKWGGRPGIDRRDDHTYAAVLGKEFGETCKAWLERDTVALRVELIQVAAVALAWAEELDNGGALTRGEDGTPTGDVDSTPGLHRAFLRGDDGT